MMDSEEARRRYVPHGRRCRQGYARATADNIRSEASAQLHRETDPVERAKTFLRRRGYVVFDASVLGGAELDCVVGRRTMLQGNMVALARRLGFDG